MKLRYIIILISAGVFLAATANASALKVAPSSLDFDYASGKTEQKILTAENPGKDAALFEVYPDDFSEQININPSSFVLNPGEKKGVVVLSSFEKQGVYATAISVVSKPLSDRTFKTNAGVKIPVEVRVGQKKSSVWPASVLDGFKEFFGNQAVLIFTASIVIILILLIIKKKKAE